MSMILQNPLRINEILRSRGIFATDLAKRLGISSQAMYKQVNGKLNIATAQKIAEALDVPLWQLFISPEEAAAEYYKNLRCPKCGEPIDPLHFHD